jgi:ribosomal protein S27AE
MARAVRVRAVLVAARSAGRRVGEARDVCPRCRTGGAFGVLAEEMEEIPGHRPTLVRSRRCGNCGITVEDRRRADLVGRR